ncbi:MAG: hypothetical protein GAK31_00164 [Stenotrophomonas maltophilia]|uniref:DUF3739 domain-containing protein n=1 Tax=Stenotrophomonas maltophilia TaxID=40324 RepID=A0A7V8FIS3_STEMA|nr:MAG: hypothetical protein GAK31_00164 [Stenotrophomonas maltophilia]
MVIERGAVLDASGASAVLDVQDKGALPVASDGGTIALRSANALYLDGTLRAAAGDAGAQGGTLGVAFGGGLYDLGTPTAVVGGPRAITLQQSASPGTGSGTTAPVYGHAVLTAAQVEAGGFDHLSLFGDVRAQGDVNLRLGQSLRLYGLNNTAFGMAAGSAAGSGLHLAAPYVRLAQTRWFDLGGNGMFIAPQAARADAAGHAFTVAAQLIDVRETVNLAGFGAVALDSRGDVRLLRSVGNNVSFFDTQLLAPSQLNITAAQIYPVSNARTRIAVGLTDPSLGNNIWGDATTQLRIHGNGQAAPLPHSVFGSLALVAADIRQGGVVRVPLGDLQLGGDGPGDVASRISLLPGSITSSSAAGLSLPYGGTVDGLSWSLDGQPLKPAAIGRTPRDTAIGVNLVGSQIDIQNGALLDLSGGGELTGAGFVSGRGGSVDIRQHALADANPAFGFSQTGNAVYAIVPPYTGSIAPAGMAQGTQDPLIGQRITVPAGVPGLAPGTYTLMPAAYALQAGAFRVELGASGVTMNVPTATGTGSWRLSGQQTQGIGTAASPLWTDLVITPAEVVRRHSGFNETPYNAFVAADAARRGMPRGAQTIDAGTLRLQLRQGAGLGAEAALRMRGSTRFGAAADSAGFGGTVALVGPRQGLELLAAGQQASLASGAAVFADALTALQPSRLLVGASARPDTVDSSVIRFSAGSTTLLVRSGVVLQAPELFLAAAADSSGRGIVVEQGATLSTLGRGKPAYDATDGYVFSGGNDGLMTLSNGQVTLLPAEAAARVPIDIGSCVVGTCTGQTRLLSEGSINVATEGSFQLRDNVSYGTRRLGLSMTAINLGNAAALQAAAAAGALPQGLALNQQTLQQLLRGNTALGRPALETLSLSARDAINVFGNVELGTRNAATGNSSLRELVLGAPAIHGYGQAGEQACIFADRLVWDGALAAAPGFAASTPQAPGAAMVDRLGHGQLDITASTLVLGRAPYTRPQSEVSANRQVLGFDGVTLRTPQQLVFGGKGRLDVHQTQGAYEAGSGWQYSGGALDIQTPLVTGLAGAKLDIRTGGALRVLGGGGGGSSDALGAELGLQAGSILLNGRIALASGRLQAQAQQSLQLGGNAQLDLAGRKVRLDDLDKYSWGGDVEVTAVHGDVVADAGSRIDVSALNNRAGRISVNALDPNAGRIALAGSPLGSASGRQATGGSLVPYDSGELFLRAQHLGDFAALNQRLDAGGFHGTRSFQIKQGDLLVADTLKARNVSISLDGGSLHVLGRIDASGEQVGSIRLAARDQLRVDGVLDAHGSALRVDSYGKIINIPNRALVELGSREGEVVLGSGARIDLRSGTGVLPGSAAGQNDGVARGSFIVNVPRRGSDDAAVRAEQGVRIDGARDLLVNAFRRYTDAPLAATPDVSGHRPQLVTQQWLDSVVDPDNQAWMNAALGNAGLGARLAALGPVRLRPGVEIVGQVSAENPDGDLTVRGDLDLSGYRYGPGADRRDPARRGFGESAALVLRAAGDINVYGSINDGFAPPPANPDESGWLLGETRDSNGTAITPLGGDVVVPLDGVSLQAGTRYPQGAVLNYAIPFVQGDVPAGSVLQQAVQLAAGGRLGAGFRVPGKATLAAQDWPAGAALPVALTLSKPIALAPGALIPSMTAVKLADGKPINLRPAAADGTQGRNWALASMLPAGTTSWDLTAVAGADLAAADPRLRQLGASGDLVLADSHYGSIGTIKTTSEWKGDRVLNEQGSLDLWGDTSHAGVLVKDAAAELSMSEDDMCSFGPYCDPAPRLVDKQGSLDWLGDESAVGTSAKDFAATFGMTEEEFCASLGYCYGGGSLIEKTAYGSKVGSPLRSVLRTGRGDLQLLAARDVRMVSGFGVYTAGTPTALGGGLDAAFNPGRAPAPGQTYLLGNIQVDKRYDPAIAAWQAWYPGLGGNLTVGAGRNILGDAWDARGEVGLVQPGETNELAGHASSAVGNWLWRQGNDARNGAQATPSAWWINFGSYSAVSDAKTARMVGFTGFGTLGGGNLRLEAGGDAGVLASMGGSSDRTAHSTAIVAAVGSTGRVTADGTLHLTGGGDLDVRLGGALNPNLAATTRAEAQNVQHLALNSTFVNLRGHLQLDAARIGGIAIGTEHYVAPYPGLRKEDPFRAQTSQPMGGPVLVLGDAVASVQARGDVVLGGVADAGRVPVANFNALALPGGTAAASSWFSLLTPGTALDLVSAGGDLTPGPQQGDAFSVNRRGEVYDERVFSQDAGEIRYWLYPSVLRMLAASGSIRLRSTGASSRDVLLTAPSASGVLEVLAMDSIFGQAGAPALSSSGADTALPTPFMPAFVATQGARTFGNTSADGTPPSVNASLPLFAFGPNMAAGRDLRSNGGTPNRFYAVQGDIIGLRTGSQWQLNNADGTRSLLRWVDVAAPVVARAGRDILLSDIGALNNTAQDITVVEAGRDVVHTSVRVAGPGNVDISAGRQLRLEDKGSVTTSGGLLQGDTRPGASVALTAGNQQLDYAALRDRYLDPRNLAGPAQPLASQPGKAVRLYDEALSQWLLQRFGYAAQGASALALFDALPAAQQRIFLRQVYYAELREGGREYNNADSPRSGSYLRGREAIATLMPDKDARGNTIDRRGDIVMYGGSGVRTEAGGTIELLAPGGQIVVGVQGVVPPASAGLVTQGQGDIHLFSQDSVLLGLSQVMTTFGGDVLAWSEQGDINAGRGSRTTLLYTPPRRLYDR